MQIKSRFLDDIARVAVGTASIVSGAKDEIEFLVRQRVERVLTHFAFVDRDEFDVVKDIATKARTQQEILQKQISEMQFQLDKLRNVSTKVKQTNDKKKKDTQPNNDKVELRDGSSRKPVAAKKTLRRKFSKNKLCLVSVADATVLCLYRCSPG